MKRTLLFVLVPFLSGCGLVFVNGPPSGWQEIQDVDALETRALTPRNLDDLPMQGPQYLDPETLEPYSGPAYRMSEDDPTQIVLRVNLRDGKFHGLFEGYHEDGRLNERGNADMGEPCGEWIYGAGETVTYPPCPPGLADGN